jgi:non-specific serine/threonine protein kinase
MEGAEYLGARGMGNLWVELDLAFREAHVRSGLPLSGFLATLDVPWHLVGRVHFHLAENRRDQEAPFAFLATFTTGLAGSGRAAHQPLGNAVRSSMAAEDRDRLLALLLPVRRAAERCQWLRVMVDTGEIYRPLRWTPAHAMRFLRDVSHLEAAGVVVRMPAQWALGRPPRARVTATVGAGAPAGLGVSALLDFSVGVTVDGEPLTPDEIQSLLAETEGLTLLRGRWVEVDRERLSETMKRFRLAAKSASRDGISFVEAMRLLAGGGELPGAGETPDREWSRIAAGTWLEETLRALRSGAIGGSDVPPAGLDATLRPYQAAGVRWLRLLSRLGLGACLADDMGLGKTIQVISLLLHGKADGPAVAPFPSLIVAPASVLSNWIAEIERFGPSLRVLAAHPSFVDARDLKGFDGTTIAQYDVVLTSYGSLHRIPWIPTTRWRHVILDEAQAIKNPGTQQARTAKRIEAPSRIALTGTPVENRPGDLWSLFDFLNPGLLGSARQFQNFVRSIEKADAPDWAPLRDLTRPYILRRMKTDPAVVPDLPSKTEMKAWCGLSRRQAALYEHEVASLTASLREVDGVARRGVVLATLTRLKQICNHPSHLLGDGAWEEAESGKFTRLREIVEIVAARQEKVLVFTQFREAAEPLASFLEGVVGRPGLLLHGGTPVGKRKDLVRLFQEDERIPFLVLSLRAGGTGLNLTAATHVVHFDRWWNPAVEEQATDRAFRIGQRRNVFVHKFVCRGTLEEKIDDLIESKRTLARDLVEGGGGKAITEMTDREILGLVALDLGAVMKEE